MVIPGSLFNRYFVPADRVLGPADFHVTEAISKKIQKLADILDSPIEDAVRVCADFIDLTPLERVMFLDGLIETARAEQRQDTEHGWGLDDAYAP